MQNLFEPLPHSVAIGQQTHALRTDHFTALRACGALEDPLLTNFEKQAIVLALLYETVPQNTAEAMRLAMLFLNCGEPSEPANSQAPPAPLYSLTHDAALIVSAIQKTHGIDVLAQPMHWYRFIALLLDVDENTFFARLIHLRRAQRTGKLTPAERRAAAALAPWMQLPQTQTLSADASAFFKQLGTAQKEESLCTAHKPATS